MLVDRINLHELSYGRWENIEKNVILDTYNDFWLHLKQHLNLLKY